MVLALDIFLTEHDYERLAAALLIYQRLAEHHARSADEKIAARWETELRESRQLARKLADRHRNFTLPIEELAARRMEQLAHEEPRNWADRPMNCPPEDSQLAG